MSNTLQDGGNTNLDKLIRHATKERATGFPSFAKSLGRNGRIIKAASRRLFEESKRQDASTFCHSPAFAALPSNLPRSTSSAPVMRSNVSIVGIRSRFSTRETIVWLSPERVATSLSESPCLSRSSRSNSINRPITAPRSDAFDTPDSSKLPDFSVAGAGGLV